uniref:Reverse transcriptase zinc-binding domain-containing protein n=1 Tax=Tetranychus urticae TaxID=32264 RepID=T1K6E2_TETUR
MRYKFAGRDFVQVIQARFNALPTRSRVWRGRGADEKSLRCRAGCNARETLNHVSQSCFRTHRVRTARHDKILDFICERLDVVGVKYVREKPISFPGKKLIPDLI